MNGRVLAACALLAVATLAVASAVAQDTGNTAPDAGDAATTVDAVAPADDPDAGDASPEPEAAADADLQPEAAADTGAEPTVYDAGRGDARRVIARRREAALVGGWVTSTRDPASFTVAVDDILLGANGEWTRRLSRVGSDQGLLAPPEETSGTWFTEDGNVVLLDRGSAVDEVLRSSFLIDDRSEQLTLEMGGGPVLYYRYR